MPLAEYKKTKNENELLTNLLKTALKIGGPGSGHFGHAGRPGLVGGSAPSKRISSHTYFTINSFSPELKKQIQSSSYAGNLLIKPQWEKMFRDKGFSQEEIDETSQLLKLYGGVKSQQNKAVAKIEEAIQSSSKIGQLLKATSDMEESAYEIWSKGGLVRAEREISMAESAWLMNGGRWGQFDSMKGNTFNDVKTYIREEAKKIPELPVYRKGDLGANIESWTTSSQGADMGAFRVSPDQESTLTKMHDRGYRVLGGLCRMMGSPGEAEVTFINFKAIESERRNATKSLFHSLVNSVFKIGGPGSGNFGHAGRPGLVGGSAPSASKVPLPYPIGSNEEWIKKVDKHLENNCIHHMKTEFNMELSEYKEEVEAWLGDIYNRAVVKIRAKSDLVKNIINDDKFKNQYETKTSNVGTNINTRNKFEKTTMNVSSKRKDRPIYGYIFEGRGDRIKQYGDAIFILKDEIKDRVSFTFGDSLDANTGGAIPDCAPMPLSSPSYHAVPYRYYISVKANKESSPEKTRHYTEAQIFGGVQIKRDVAKVIFTNKAPDNETIHALTSAGIKYEHNPEYVEKSFSLREAFKIGGPGSGNFGHAGRPGIVGGSAPSKRGGLPHEEIIRNVGIRIDHSHLDNKVSVKLNGAVADFCNKYPRIKGAVQHIKVEKDDEEGVMSYYSFKEKLVVLNSDFFAGKSIQDLEKRHEYNMSRNFAPKNTDWTSLIYHELSHGLLRRVEFQHGKGKDVFKEIRNQSLKKAGVKVKDIGKNLSAYATLDPEEFIAESFGEFHTSSAPRELSKITVGTTLEYLNSGRSGFH